MSRSITRRARVAILILLTGAMGACTTPGARPVRTGLGVSAERLDRLESVQRSYIEDEALAGTVTLVMRDGRTVYSRALGDRDRATHSPMREDTIFRIASQSKAIVSTAVMILQEEGKLVIADPVGRYLPEFLETTVAVPREGGGYDIVPAARPITIRDLLTHTSGFDYGNGVAEDRWKDAGIHGYYFSDRNEPIRETVRRMADLPATAQPGERWVYGYNTDILGALVEVVAGMPLDVVLRERIFAPLAMHDTHFYLPPAQRDRLATVYARRDGRLERAPDDGAAGQGAFVDGPRASFSGGAGLVSTARDYARFLQMILNGGALDGARILSPKTVELMGVDHLPDSIDFSPGLGMGLGFAVTEDLGARGIPGSVGELGWGGAYHSTFWIDRAEELVVVYMTQLIPTGAIDDHAKLRTLVYQAIVE